MENITQPTLHAELEATAPWLNRLIRPDIASLRPQLSAHYFETLQENVCEYLNLQEETPVLAALRQQKRTNDLPTGYFEALEDTVLEKIRLQEETPVLVALRQQTSPQNLPVGYFDTVADNVFAVLHAPQANPAPALRIAVANKSKKSTWQWAASAVGIAATVVGIVFWANQSAPETTDLAKADITLPTEKLFASVSKNDAAAYLTTHADEIDETLLQARTTNITLDKMMPSLNTKELLNYIDDTDLTFED